MKRILTCILSLALVLSMLPVSSLASNADLINPDKNFIIKCLKTVSDVSAIGAASKSNDPNGHLGDPGYYTAAVFFSSTLVRSDAKSMTANEVIKAGTSGGGCVEVYRSSSDAKARHEYLYKLRSLSGYSTVVGSVVVRISSSLSETQQKKLANAIVTALKSGSATATPKATKAATAKPKATATPKPTATPAPVSTSIADNNFERMTDYIMDHYYWTYLMPAIGLGANIASAFDVAGSPLKSATYSTQDDAGSYNIVYSEQDDTEEPLIYKITFTSSFEDTDKVMPTIVTIASALGVLPAHDASGFESEVDWFTLCMKNGRSYSRNGASIVMMINTNVDGKTWVCAIFDGLENLK